LVDVTLVAGGEKIVEIEADVEKETGDEVKGDDNEKTVSEETGPEPEEGGNSETQ